MQETLRYSIPNSPRNKGQAATQLDGLGGLRDRLLLFLGQLYRHLKTLREWVALVILIIQISAERR